MKRLLVTSMVMAAVALALAWVEPAAVSLAAIQRGAAGTAIPANTAPAGSVPRMADGHPDLSGVWWPGSDIGGRRGAPAGGQAGARGAGRGAPAGGRGATQ